jgi:hypothetical protein
MRFPWQDKRSSPLGHSKHLKGKIEGHDFCLHI